MKRRLHREGHFTGSEHLRDIVIGMSDGLTVPFALAAGLSGAVSKTSIIVIAGLAEIAAGSIAMGLGGYLAAKGDAEHYRTERAREDREVVEIPEEEEAEVSRILQEYGVTAQQAEPVVKAIAKHPTRWVDFMMRFELGLEEPDPKRARTSAVTIALAYVFGGFIPLSPYFIAGTATTALLASVVVTLIALLVFGYVKGRFAGTRAARSALETMLIGGVAAAAAFGLAKLFS